MSYAGFVRNDFSDPSLKAVGGWYNKEYYDRFKVIHFAFKTLPEGATVHGNKAIPNRKLTSDPSTNNVEGDPSIANDPAFIEDLAAMMKAAGVNTYSSGYRTLSYINGTNRGGKSKDRAPAGGSEHQTGYCVDTPSTKITTAQFNAINAVAHKYGFAQTFTRANSSKTNVVVENWHWKWLGNAKARSLLTPIDGSLAGMMALSYGGVDKAIEWSKKVKTKDTGTLYEALKSDFEALKAGKKVTGSGVGGTSTGSASSDADGGGSSTSAPSTSTTARKPTNTGATSVCKTLEVDPRVKEAFELAFKALYPDGKVDFGPVPTSQPPLGQTTPPPAGPGSGAYTQTPTAGGTVGEDGKISDGSGGSKESGDSKQTEETKTTEKTGKTGEAK